MKEVGLTPPTATNKTFVVMGKTFDPAKPEDYIKSFAIKRAAKRRDVVQKWLGLRPALVSLAAPVRVFVGAWHVATAGAGRP